MPDKPELVIKDESELHPYGRCHACGERGELVQVAHVATHGRSWRCDDVVACARRIEIEARAA